MRISTTDAEPTVTTTYETAQLIPRYWDAKTADLRSAVMAEYIVFLTVDFLNRVDGAFSASPQRPVTRGSASESHGVESSDRRSERGMRALARSTGVEAAAPLGASVRVAIKPPSVAAARPHKKRGRGELVRSSAACPSAAAPSPRRSPLGERNGERDSNHRSCAVDRTPPTGFASQMCGVGVVAPHSTQVAGRVLNMLNKAWPRRGALSYRGKRFAARRCLRARSLPPLQRFKGTYFAETTVITLDSAVSQDH